MDGQTFCQFWCFYDVSFSICRSTPIRRITRPCDLYLWPCSSWRCRWYGSSYFTSVSSFMFVGLSLQMIRRTFGLTFSRPCDLDLWPWNWCTLLPVMWATFLPMLVFLGRFVLDLSTTSCQTRHGPCDIDLRPWRSRCLLMTRVFVLHVCTKFEVRRPSRSLDIADLLCEH